MKHLTFTLMLFLITGCAPHVIEPRSPKTSSTLSRTPLPIDHAPTEEDFSFGGNLKYDDLVAVSRHVTAAKRRHQLSNRQVLNVIAEETRKASKIRWLIDGKKWIVRSLF